MRQTEWHGFDFFHCRTTSRIGGFRSAANLIQIIIKFAFWVAKAKRVDFWVVSCDRCKCPIDSIRLHCSYQRKVVVYEARSLGKAKQIRITTPHSFAHFSCSSSLPSVEGIGFVLESLSLNTVRLFLFSINGLSLLLVEASVLPVERLSSVDCQLRSLFQHCAWHPFSALCFVSANL